MDRYAAEGTAERVRADLALSYFARGDLGDEAQSRALALRALELAQRLDDRTAIAEAATPLLRGAITPPEDHDERMRIAEMVTGRSFSEVRPDRLNALLTAKACTLLSWGDRNGAEDLLRQAAEAAEKSGAARSARFTAALRALLQTLDGQLEAALQTGERLRAVGLELGVEQPARQYVGLATRRPLLHLGRAEEALVDIFEPAELFANGGNDFAQRALFLAEAGRVDEARVILDRFKAKRDFGRPGDQTSSLMLRYLLEAGVAAGDRELASVLARRFAPLAGLLHVDASMAYCIGRLCGGAAALLGEPEKAREYYQQAIEICTKVRFRPELALTRLELAELLLAHYPAERAAAVDHLDFAIGELREMKMTPSLERALRHKDVLKA